jgi:hypothetical protein
MRAPSGGEGDLDRADSGWKVTARLLRACVEEVTVERKLSAERRCRSMSGLPRRRRRQLGDPGLHACLRNS